MTMNLYKAIQNEILIRDRAQSMKDISKRRLSEYYSNEKAKSDNIEAGVFDPNDELARILYHARRR